MVEDGYASAAVGHYKARAEKAEEMLRRWLLLNDSMDYELLEAEFGEIEHPGSSLYVERYLDRVLRQPSRAALTAGEQEASSEA